MKAIGVALVLAFAYVVGLDNILHAIDAADAALRASYARYESETHHARR